MLAIWWSELAVYWLAIVDDDGVKVDRHLSFVFGKSDTGNPQARNPGVLGEIHLM